MLALALARDERGTQLTIAVVPIPFLSPSPCITSGNVSSTRASLMISWNTLQYCIIQAVLGSVYHPSTFAHPVACPIAHSSLCAAKTSCDTTRTHNHGRPLMSEEPGHWKALRSCRRMRRKVRTTEVVYGIRNCFGKQWEWVLGTAWETVTRNTCGRSPKSDGYVIPRDAIVVSTQWQWAYAWYWNVNLAMHTTIPVVRRVSWLV